jgi:hypothetical protein
LLNFIGTNLSTIFSLLGTGKQQKPNASTQTVYNGLLTLDFWVDGFIEKSHPPAEKGAQLIAREHMPSVAVD